MFNTGTVSRFMFVISGTLAWSLTGCDGTQSQTSAGTSASDLASVEAALTAAEDSLASAQDEAKGCFETYRACKAAEDANSESCREALKACLPADAPSPRHCHGGHRGQDNHRRDHGLRHGATGITDDAAGGASSDADDVGGTSAAPKSEHSRHHQHGASAEDDALWSAVAGRTGADSGTAVTACERPPIDAAELEACIEAASASLDVSSDAEASSTVHEGCVAKAFGRYVTHVCKESTALCAEPDAPADACARIAALCGALSVNENGSTTADSTADTTAQ